MSLLSPIFLLGLAGLALPIVAHFWGRERPRVVPFAAIRFLQAAEARITQRKKIRDPWLLALRLLLLLTMIVAIARPVSWTSSTLNVVREPHDAVILVDTSASMDLRTAGRSQRYHAHNRILALVDALPAGTRLGFISSDPHGLQVEITDIHGRVLEASDQWAQGTPRLGNWTLTDALPAAAALLSGSEGSRLRVIYAIGDSTARGLGTLPPSFEGGIRVLPVATDLEDAASDKSSRDHVGISAVSWEPDLELSSRAIRVHATLFRHGPKREDNVPTSVTAVLEIDDAEVARADVVLIPGHESTLEFSHTLDDLEHQHAAVVRLSGMEQDPLAFDNTRHLWISAHARPEILIVNGDPSEQRANDEVFFLGAAAGSTSTNTPTRIQLRGTAPGQFERNLREHGDESLREVDVLLLANVEALQPESIQVVRRRIEQGMGLWITVGGRVVPSQYNERFADILPLPLRGTTYANSAPGRTQIGNEGIAPVVLGHPIFSGQGADLDLGSTRTHRMMLLEPDARRPTQVAVAFNNGAPALITRELGKGRVALLTTTIDRAWGDLPLRPGFVPLVQQTLAWLAGEAAQQKSARLRVGESYRLPTEGPYRVSTPAGDLLSVLGPTPGAPVAGQTLFSETHAPGHYEIHRPGDHEKNAAIPFVVQVDPLESDTHRLPIAEAPSDSATLPIDVHQPRWRTLLWLAVLLVALESLLRLIRARGSAVNDRK